MASWCCGSMVRNPTIPLETSMVESQTTKEEQWILQSLLWVAERSNLQIWRLNPHVSPSLSYYNLGLIIHSNGVTSRINDLQISKICSNTIQWVVDVSSPSGRSIFGLTTVLFRTNVLDPPIAVSCHLFSNQRYGGGTDIFSFRAGATCKTPHIWQNFYVVGTTNLHLGDSGSFSWLFEFLQFLHLGMNICEKCSWRGRWMVVKGTILEEWCFVAIHWTSISPR